MTDKINIFQIIRDHFKTFRDEGAEKVSFSDYFIFLVIPIIVAGAAYFFDICFPNKHFGVFISAYSIFTGLLFNILVLIYTLSDSGADAKNMSGKRVNLRNRLIRELFANISFSILLCVASVVMLSAMAFGGFIGPEPTSFVVFLSVMFVFSLFMILKRIHVLLSDKF